MSAFVEIIFDNSDDRFHTGKPEFTLRRTIGTKKDEYSVDRKSTTKTEVNNTLESAGFSRSNPYYIVPQGRVTALTNMKDGERLKLLKEVAGSQVYEARRAESLKIMTETENKRAKIDELLAYIKDRLSELEEEKEELRDYEEKNKERRCLQYTIDHREQMNIQQELETLEEARQTRIDDADDNRDRFLRGEMELTEIEQEIKKLSRDADLLRVDKRQLDNEKKDSTKRKAQLELEYNTLNEGQSAAERTEASRTQEVQTIQQSIQQREKELRGLEPEFKKRQTEEAKVRTEHDKAETIRSRLYAKQGRNQQFKNKQERDQGLQNEIDGNYPQMAKMKADRMQTEEDITDLQKQVARGEADIEGLRKQLDQQGTSSDSIQAQLREKKSEVEKVHDERQEMWREDAKLDSILGSTGEEMRRAESTLSHRMDADTSRGLAAIRRIKQRHNLEGLYGTLGELMNVDEKFAIAVETIGGNSLFHYVVDNDETASNVLQTLQKERSGRVTFMPLNRLKARHIPLPKAADAVPMIDRLEYDRLYHKAFMQVFGKTIICPSLAVAQQYARTHGVDAITMDGDRADKKGALSGGYQDPRKSRLEAIRNVTKWRKEYEAQSIRSSELKKAVDKKQQELTIAKGELLRLEQTKQKQENGYLSYRHQLQSLASSVQNRKDDLDGKTRALTTIDSNIKVLSDQQTTLEAEKASEFKKVLTKEEEDELKDLSSSIPALRKQYSEAATARGGLESRKSTVEIELRERWRPRLDQLSAQAYDYTQTGSSTQMQDAQKELKRVEKTVARLERRVQELEKSIDDANAQVAELEQRRATTRQQQEETARSIDKQQKRVEKGMQRKSRLQKQGQEVAARIRELGMLPQDAFSKYDRMKPDAVVSRLRKVNDALKKYSHVNKKAFQQYEQFTNQRETLSTRRAELDSSQASIEELIEVLDQRKDEAIERTFKQVSREFASVFEALVPAGRGRLVIQRKTDQRAGDDEDSDDAEQENVENYTGVGISVSFNSKHDDQQRIQQLSGGQKSRSLSSFVFSILSHASGLISPTTGLCALALVFAIQRCDPAPFYLFDEIDANLDAQYRTAVAQMLQSLCARDGHTQFICTTFRPEMLLVAEKCYGVRYMSKNSSVVVVSREEAMDFVQGEVPQ